MGLCPFLQLFAVSHKVGIVAWFNSTSLFRFPKLMTTNPNL